MSETKFTPGPWRYVPWHVEEGPPAVRSSEDWIVCTTASDDDARLIAAAPEMYEALETVAQLLRDHHADQGAEDGWQNEELRDAWVAARDALAKAEGRS